MDELEKSLSNLNIGNRTFEFTMKGKPQQFMEYNGCIFRYDQKTNSWKDVCKSKEPRQCYSYATKNGFCNHHQNKSIEEKDPNKHRYFTISIKGLPRNFCDFQNERYRYSSTRNIWGRVCKFVYEGGERCTNYETCDGFCDKHKNGIEIFDSSTTIGDKTEQFIAEILNKSDDFEDVTVIGRENSELDIIFKVKGEDIFHGVQVKTITIQQVGGYFCCHVGGNIEKYSDSTVIVGASKEREILFCCFASVLKTLGNSITFNMKEPSQMLRPYIFYGIDDNSLGYTFSKMLYSYSRLSTLYSKANISIAAEKERESISRIKTIYEHNNISFNFYHTGDSPIDCIINGKNIQCKYSETREKDHSAFFKLQKYKNNIEVCYEGSDKIDFFIFESYDNNFWVIPIEVMIYFGYIKDSKNNGKVSITLHKIDSPSNHWSKKFLFKFELVLSITPYNLMLLFDLTNLIDRFIYESYYRGISIERDMNNLSTNTCKVNNKRIKCLRSSKVAGNNYIFILKSGKYQGLGSNITRDNIPDFFVFNLGINNEFWYIIPKEVMIFQKLIGTSEFEGVTDFGLPIPGAVTIRKNKEWTQHFISAFHLLNI